MQIIQVKPGADRQALALIAKHMGLRVGIQGGMQVMIADSAENRGKISKELVKAFNGAPQQ